MSSAFGKLLAISVVACYGFTAQPSWSAEKTKVKIAQVADFFLYAPIYVAFDAGLFSQVGLDVTILNTGGDEKTWAAVLSGDADFGVGDPTFVAISAARGRDGKAIASIVNGVPFWGVTWRQDIDAFSSSANLKGRSIATFPAPSTAYTLQHQMFVNAGLGPDIREGAFGALLTMVKAGRADIALELEPNVSQAVAQGARVVYSLADIYGDFAITGLTATPQFLARSPEIAGKVVCALQIALDKMQFDSDGALALLRRRFPEITPEVARSAYDRALKAGIVPQQARIEPAAWQKAIGLRRATGDLKESDSMPAYVDNSFADAALADKNCRLKH